MCIKPTLPFVQITAVQAAGAGGEAEGADPQRGGCACDCRCVGKQGDCPCHGPRHRGALGQQYYSTYTTTVRTVHSGALGWAIPRGSRLVLRGLGPPSFCALHSLPSLHSLPPHSTRHRGALGWV
jgi:hypothetical protein